MNEFCFQCLKGNHATHAGDCVIGDSMSCVVSKCSCVCGCAVISVGEKTEYCPKCLNENHGNNEAKIA